MCDKLETIWLNSCKSYKLCYNSSFKLKYQSKSSSKGHIERGKFLESKFSYTIFYYKRFVTLNKDLIYNIVCAGIGGSSGVFRVTSLILTSSLSMTCCRRSC